MHFYFINLSRVWCPRPPTNRGPRTKLAKDRCLLEVVTKLLRSFRFQAWFYVGVTAPSNLGLAPQCDMKHCLTNSKHQHIDAKRSKIRKKFICGQRSALSLVLAVCPGRRDGYTGLYTRVESLWRSPDHLVRWRGDTPKSHPTRPLPCLYSPIFGIHHSALDFHGQCPLPQNICL